MRSLLLVSRSRFGLPEEKGTVLLDDDDYLDVIQYKWYLKVYYRSGKRHIAVSRVSMAADDNHLRRSHVLLPRHILGIDDPSIRVSYVDGNPLNCQKRNLLIVASGYDIRRLRDHWIRNTTIRWERKR